MTRTRGTQTPEQFIKANGLTLCYQEFGRPADPPLILIMGMGAQMIGWEDDFCTALASCGYRVIRFDNRDIGRSSWLDHAGLPNVPRAMMLAWMRRPVTAPYLLDDMALDVVGLLDALKIDSAHIVGLSMGATIAQALAIRHPRRVRSMTSIMSTTGNPDLPAPKTWAMSAVMRVAPHGLDEYVEYYASTWKALRIMSTPEDERRDRARAARNHERGLHAAGGARHLVAILASGSRRRALAQVATPTLVIHGDVDPLVPLAAGIDTAKSIPGARLLVFEGMGHALPVSTWPAVIEALDDHIVRAEEAVSR